MLSRLFAFLLGRRRPSRDQSAYPVVGSSTAGADQDATLFWPATAPADGLDATVMATPPEPLEDAQPAGAGSRERLAWPARDVSRSPPAAKPAREDATVIVNRRPAAAAPRSDDATVLVPRHGRPRPPVS